MLLFGFGPYSIRIAFEGTFSRKFGLTFTLLSFFKRTVSHKVPCLLPLWLLLFLFSQMSWCHLELFKITVCPESRQLRKFCNSVWHVQMTCLLVSSFWGNPRELSQSAVLVASCSLKVELVFGYSKCQGPLNPSERSQSTPPFMFAHGHLVEGYGRQQGELLGQYPENWETKDNRSSPFPGEPWVLFLL